MIVLHIIVNLDRGGAELMLHRLVEAHAANPDHRHHVISLTGLGTVGPQLEAAGATVEALGMTGPLHMPRVVRHIKSAIRGLSPDIVQTWMYHGDLLGGLAARAVGKREVIWNVRNAHILPGRGTSRITSMIRMACALLSRRIPARIVYVGESARRLHEKLGYAPGKSVVIPNGYLVPQRQADADNRLRLRRELGIPADTLLIGSAGRYNALKDHVSFIRAAELIAERRPDVRFLMLGKGIEPSNAALTGALKDRRMLDRFHMLGEKLQIEEYLVGLDIFCLHSISEGFPNVVAEAMSVAIPCVVTDVGDAASLVAETGFVVTPRDFRHVADGLDRMIEIGAEERTALGGAARERIKAMFSMNSVAERYHALYLEVMNKPESTSTP